MVDNRFAFTVDWYDAQASLIRKYQLLYYPIDGTLELYDIKAKRHFLKRCKYEGIQPSDLYLGNTVTILSRTMNIVEYADVFTSRALERNQEKVTGVLLVGHFNKLGQMLDSVYKSDLKITKLKRIQISSQEAIDVLQNQRHKPNFTSLVNGISNGPIVVVELLGSDAQSKWKNIIGLGDLAGDLEQDALNRINDGTFRAGNQKLGMNTATYNDCTCCIIKPHIVAAGMLGAVIYEIQKAGFEISALQAVSFSKPNAEEFLEVYKGVVQEYSQLVDEIISGLCVALEIRAQNAQTIFREFCGPHDPEIARALRPKTLRALFGSDKIRNAVHCTDLSEDAALEVEYFFRILDQ